ncbi:MAG: AAA family ATPase [Succinivibrio sp.]|nr:AAA family ATPase [Succinivibrio sp.]
MTAYLDPKSTGFSDLAGSAYFVDKTPVIACLNHCMEDENLKYMCLTSPPHFGKSVTAEMLCTYYGRGLDSASLFYNLKIAEEQSYSAHLNQHHVIFINMAQEYQAAGFKVKALLARLTSQLHADLEAVFPGMINPGSTTLRHMLFDIHEATRNQTSQYGESFIFIIDDYDCVVRNSQVGGAELCAYLDFLTVLLKDKDYVKLCYLTGLLPIKKLGTHGGLNMFREYTVLCPGRFAPYIGFTEGEVKALCETHVRNFEEMSCRYDGYTSAESEHIFTPGAVISDLNSDENVDCRSHNHSNEESLGSFLRLNFKGLKDAIVRLLTGDEELIDTLGFENDLTSFKNRDHVLTLLVHLGYLTATPAESSYRKFWVRVPNREVREGLEAVILDEKKYTKTAAALRGADKLLEALQQGDEQAVARGVARAHEQCCSVLTYNDENSLACALTLAFYSARDHYTLIRELPSGKGFADLVFIPHPGEDLPALLLELKYDRSAETALSQIKDKHYPRALEAYRGNLILAGISYDPKTKEHHCHTERS